MFMAFTNVYSLLDLFRSVNSGWGMQIALDTTFDINDRQMNMLTCGVTALEGHYHPLLSAFIPGDSESFVMYRNSWKALSAAAHALIADLQLCVLQTCPICSVIRQIKEQPQFVAFMRTKAAKAFSFPIISILGDGHKGIKKLAIELKVDKNDCVQHKAVIAYKNGQHVIYFSSREAYNAFYEIISRAANIAVVVCAETIQRKILEYLRMNGEDKAADWFEEMWMGDNCRWMLAYVGYGLMGGNNGQESTHKYHHGATGGPNRGNMSLPFFLSQHMGYMADYSERLEAAAVKSEIPVYTLQREPKPKRRTWELLQRMDYRTILVAQVQIDGSRFRSVQDELASLYEEGDNMYNMMMRLPVRDLAVVRDMETLFMPSQCLIRDVDPDGKMSVEDLRAALLPSYQEFRTAIMEECLDIYEKWYLLKAIAGKPWSPWARWKCICAACNQDGLCHHGLACTCLCRPLPAPRGEPEPEPLVMPSMYLVHGVPGRRKRGRPKRSGDDADFIEEPKKKKVKVPVSIHGLIFDVCLKI